VEKIFKPRMPRAKAAELRSRWNKALDRSKAWEPAQRKPSHANKP